MIDAGTAITIATGVAGVVGGYFGGKKTSAAQGDTVSAQASAIEALRTRIDLQDMTLATIPGMKDEIRILQGLVTQRANVEEVINIVTRIEEKVDAQGR